MVNRPHHFVVTMSKAINRAVDFQEGTTNTSTATMLTMQNLMLFSLFLDRQGSVASTESSFAGGEGPNVPINEYQAAWNVTNAIQGMFIVSLPYAVLRGGYWAIIAMVGIAYICCYTGKVRHKCPESVI